MFEWLAAMIETPHREPGVMTTTVGNAILHIVEAEGKQDEENYDSIC